MTCIVGFVGKSGVYLGGDSAGVSHEFDIDDRLDVKVFKNKGFLIGYTTSFRMGQLLRFKLNPPAHPKGMDTYHYMCTLFIDAVMTAFHKNVFLQQESGVAVGGTFLVAYRNRLFTIYNDFQVAESSTNYAAIGCGERYAKGALCVLSALSKDGAQISDAEIVRTALSAAEFHSAGVRAPFIIAGLNKNGKLIK